MGKALRIELYKSRKPTVVTIGTFDGVHVGHQKILKRLISIGKKESLKSTVLTFFPHPRIVLQKDTDIKLINTIDERSEILNQLGLDQLLIKEFTKEFSRLSAEEFVKHILVDTLNTKKIIIGYDHRFGRNRNADIKDLKKYGDVFGFNVQEISAKDIDDVAVSSTKIRKALIEGNVMLANTFLGYEFTLTGNIIKGKQIGEQLGYPTANINIKESYKLIPKKGSYVVKSLIKNEVVFGMMNIGVNPTVNGEIQSIEVHFFDFNSSIYNKKITVKVLQRIRDEKKFDSLEALKAQLKKDKQFCLTFLKTYYVQ